MSIQTQITRIQEARNSIRTKLVELHLVENSANITDLATAVTGIQNNGNVSAEVKEGETYTIARGWHDGSGTVSGVAGGGNYTLQSKTVTPTKAEQNIVPDEGKYGLSDVTVAPIPEQYQDVSSVTATADTVLTGKIFVDATGKQIAGEMVNNGAVDKTIDTKTTSYNVPKGYHDGLGVVKVVTEEKSATPTKEEQVLNATTGKVISKVTIAPIPDEYQVVTNVTATAETVLVGSKFVDATGAEVDGTMANNGNIEEVISVANPSVTIPAGKHGGEGTVSIVTETKEVTPTKSAQTVNATEGKVIASFTVAPIPAEYQVVTNVTATAAKVLDGSVFVDATGAEIEGTMPNKTGYTATIDGLTTTSVTLPEGYYSGVETVSLTGDIEELLAAI